MQYAMFLVLKDIRNKSLEDLLDILTKRLASDPETFATRDRFRLHGANRGQVHRTLARITAFLECDTDIRVAERFKEYLNRQGRDGYEVEHIWANHPEDHKAEFPNASDFLESRNRIGGLLLLPKEFNASYGDLPYEDFAGKEGKYSKYFGQNLLAKSLNHQCYANHPRLLSLRNSGLPFREHRVFNKADLEERSVLYRKIAERIWDPTRLASAAT